MTNEHRVAPAKGGWEIFLSFRLFGFLRPREHLTEPQRGPAPFNLPDIGPRASQCDKYRDKQQRFLPFGALNRPLRVDRSCYIYSKVHTLLASKGGSAIMALGHDAPIQHCPLID